ncbi:MAG: DnaJ domain-containing protein, partial [Candidatus Sericytochromatia bacterium]|nr:DnaJ domain-containing protein [Candidatus Sericytochromatia bacterium]
MRGTKRFIAERDYYQILSVDDNATSREVDDSFQALAKPKAIEAGDSYEQQKEAQRLMLVAKAYEILSDPIERAAYDRRRFGTRLPENEKIETLFNQGVKAFRQKQIPTASKCLREAVHLFPHRVLYRVHLAICYLEQGWKAMAENELKMALRIDPNDGFAQETVARLLYKMPDSKKQAVLGRRWHKQAASIAAVLVVVAGVWATFPRHSSAADPTVEGNSPEAIALGGGARPTAAPAQAAAPAAAPAAAGQTLPKLAADFQPDGAKRDYTTQTITRKTYYPAQGMVIAACKDGGMLNYKPTELLGWKQGEAGKVILITKTGEMIPAPAGVPLLMPNGENVNVKDKSFPLHLFPEYGTTTIKTAAAAGPAA